jgi:hypothetical protein
MSRDSLVGIATSWTAWIQYPAGARDFSLLHSAQTGCEASPASYPMGTRGVKQPGSEADHSPPSSAEVMNSGTILPLPHMSS